MYPIEPILIENKCVKKAVYIIQIINSSYFKIGVSEIMSVRFKDLQQASPFDLKIIYSKEFRDYILIEAYLHNYFIKNNVRGEWFELMAEDVYEIVRFLSQLENADNIKGEISKRLRLQKKHKQLMRSIQRQPVMNGRIQTIKLLKHNTPVVSTEKKTGEMYVGFRAIHPDTGKRIKFILKRGINREKSMSVRKLKADNLKSKLVRFLDSGLSPFEHKEAFLQIGLDAPKTPKIRKDNELKSVNNPL